MRFYETGTLLRTQDPLADATVYPIIDYDYIFKNPIVGGELSFNSNIMALANADGTDSNRLIMQTAWRRQMIDRIGQVYTPFAQLRGDLYGMNEFVDPATDFEFERCAGARHRRRRRGVSLSVHRHDRQRRPCLRADRPGHRQARTRSASISRRSRTRMRRASSSTTPSCSTSTSSPATTASRPAPAPMSAFATPRNCRHGAYARAVFGESYQLAGQNSFDEQYRPRHQVLRLCRAASTCKPRAISALVGAGALRPGYVRPDAHRPRLGGVVRPGRPVW